MEIQNIKLGTYLGEGAWGTVYEVEDNSKLAVKVFKRNPDKNYEDVLRVFQYEVAAHEQALKCNELSQYVPEYYGKANTDIDRENHYPDMAFVMQRLEGPTGTKGAPPEIKEMFERCGIKGVDDISALIVPGTTDIKYVDFSLKKYLLNHEGGVDFD